MKLGKGRIVSSRGVRLLNFGRGGRGDVGMGVVMFVFVGRVRLDRTLIDRKRGVDGGGWLVDALIIICVVDCF